MSKVSIIVPCYNQAEYLQDCLQSVLEQTIDNWECIIVNDGSPDDTGDVAQAWLAKDKRFKYIYKENGGLSSARNAGIEKAAGEFILPLDADDRIGKEYLELAIQAFQNDSSLKLVYCKAEKFGEESGEWQLSEFSLHQLAIENMIFCSALFKKSDWQKTKGYDVNLIYGLEDWEFWISLLKNGGDVLKLDCIGFYYRIKTVSMIKMLNQDIVVSKRSIFEYISIKHADFFVSQLGSFMCLNNKLEKQLLTFNEKLKSEKFVLKLFVDTVLTFLRIK